jgi:hypothetical protein
MKLQITFVGISLRSTQVYRARRKGRVGCLECRFLSAMHKLKSSALTQLTICTILWLSENTASKLSIWAILCLIYRVASYSYHSPQLPSKIYHNLNN